MKSKTTLVLFMGYIASLLITGTCFAENGKVYPGSNCKSYFTNQDNYISHGSGGSLTNKKHGPMWVTCPVPKNDNRALYYNGRRTKVNVDVFVWHNGRSSDSYYCELRSTDIYFADNHDFDSDTIPSSQAYEHLPINLEVDRSSYTTTVLNCRLPSYGSVLKAYTVHAADHI